MLRVPTAGSARQCVWIDVGGNVGEISYHSHSNRTSLPTAELIFGSTARHQNRLVWTPAGVFLLFSLVFISIHPSSRAGMGGLYYSSCCWIWAFICWFVWRCSVVFCPWDNSGLSLAFDVHGEATLFLNVYIHTSLLYRVYICTYVYIDNWQLPKIQCSGDGGKWKHGRKREKERDPVMAPSF